MVLFERQCPLTVTQAYGVRYAWAGQPLSATVTLITNSALREEDIYCTHTKSVGGTPEPCAKLMAKSILMN